MPFDGIRRQTRVKAGRGSQKNLPDQETIPNGYRRAWTQPRCGVKLVIYNLLGQQIATLVDEFQPSGNYTAKWNGRTDFGRLLSSGVYFYKMSVDDGKFTDTKKMLLLK